MPRAIQHVLDPNPRRKPKKDLTGKTIGRWLVIKFAGREKWVPFWKCKCRCGTIRIVQDENLRKKATKSCGCRSEELKRKRTTHGCSRRRFRSTEYSTWANMIQRCVNPKSVGFRDYGGRGIKVCKRWRKSFSNFLLDMGPKPSTEFSIERKKFNRGYTPSNCIWRRKNEQSQNRRNCVLLTYNGETLPRHTMAKKYGIKPFTLRTRLHLGMSVKEAIERPVK